MALILVVDDTPMCREPIAALLEARGVSALCASDGKEALAILERQTPDVILLDLGLPDMDGLIFLRSVRADPRWRAIPVVVLSAVMEKTAVIAAAKLGVKDYLLKSQFSLKELLKRLEQYIPADPRTASKGVQASADRKTVAQSLKTENSAAPSKNIAGIVGQTAHQSDRPTPVPRQKALSRLKAYKQIKALPGIVADVVAMASSPRCDMTDLVALLKREPMLAARVLQMANSAAFATCKTRITTIEEAVRNIGLSSVRNIATAVGIMDSLAPEVFTDFDLIRCWQHSLAVARLMELFPRNDDSAAGLAYLVGLCHDLAEIVLRQCFATEYAAILAYRATSSQALAHIEETTLGVSRSEFSALILSKLGLPAPITGPIAEFFEHPAGTPGIMSPLATQLRMANDYANGMLLSSDPMVEITPVTALESKVALGHVDPPVVNPDALRAEVLLLTSLLFPAFTREVSQPLLPHRPIAVAYFPDESLSSFDPVYAALRMLSDAALFHDFPISAEGLKGATRAVIALPAGPSDALLCETQQRWKAVFPDAIPVLYLTDRQKTPSGAEPFTVLNYPVTPHALASWIGRDQENVHT